MHQEQSRPGRVGALLEKRGYELHRLCPNLGCNLPEDMSDYAGVVIFGGPMSANDCGTLAGIKCELDWIPKVIEAGVPYLGLCLGAQLLTRAVGGRVSPHPEGKVEIGYVDIEPTEAGRAWFKGPMKVYQWHREGMHIPDCCELLATNDTYPVQGFRCGPNAFGFQFHPEVTLEMKEIWTLNSRAPEAARRPAARRASLACTRSTIRRSTAGSTASSIAGWRPTSDRLSSRACEACPISEPARSRCRRRMSAASAR